MNTEYFKEHEIFIDNLTKLLQREFSPHIDGWEADGFYPNSVYDVLGREGYLGLILPEEYGGSAADYKLASAWCETFGRLPAVGMTVGVNMHSVVVSHALAQHGTKAAKDRWLPKAVTGEAIGAYAFTEPGVGSDLAHLTTRAEKKGGRWVINGAKTFITNGARAHFVLVLTRTDPKAGYKGFTTFLVDTSQSGFSVSRKLDKLGWRSSDTAELVFEDVEVDESCVLGEIGGAWRIAMQNLNWERLMLVLTSLGGAKVCYEDTLRYARDRSAFGQPIGTFGVISDLLDEMHRKILLGEALSYAAVDALCSGKDARLKVALAKRRVCEDAIWLADRAIQIHGGYGYTTEFSPERWWRDLRLMTIGGGTSEIMGNVLAKELHYC